jgi:hypothetical protein
LTTETERKGCMRSWFLSVFQPRLCLQHHLQSGCVINCCTCKEKKNHVTLTVKILASSKPSEWHKGSSCPGDGHQDVRAFERLRLHCTHACMRTLAWTVVHDDRCMSVYGLSCFLLLHRKPWSCFSILPVTSYSD